MREGTSGRVQKKAVMLQHLELTVMCAPAMRRKWMMRLLTICGCHRLERKKILRERWKKMRNLFEAGAV